MKNKLDLDSEENESVCSTATTSLDKLLEQNRRWANERVAANPAYFDRLTSQQAPEYLWIGCSDSRVPANVIVGLEPGEVFVQRNVGNQATHTDMNVMACLEYAVTELKVKTIICCGHYGCGAVKAALRLPSKTQGVVNCWISDIRECRNQHHHELKALGPQAQVDRLCELNVIRQTFHVCTSPVVQNAWDQDQQLEVYGLIYGLKDGLMKRLVGPLTKHNIVLDILEYEQQLSNYNQSQSQSQLLTGALSGLQLDQDRHSSGCKCGCSSGSQTPLDRQRTHSDLSPDRTTAELASRVAAHVLWSTEAGADLAH